MNNVFTVRRKNNSQGKELSKEYSQRLRDLGFQEDEKQYSINLNTLQINLMMKEKELQLV